MIARATEAAALLKALPHEGRLMILCHLSGGERAVGELEQLPGQRQAAVSLQLARLRADGLATRRREGKTRLYSIAAPKAAEVIATVYRLFCTE
ncbi:MAG: metalloregulator ArsR/SmtB family transcription factor [Paracoccus sp. (in: a-proteobacteria)]|uniref:ArsR/SmtB family transcription factor n=1 Tax=Paracoccus sp. TaxID=267 RepID=UPI0026DEA64A|nr:metalloregulator ArsR/SmtB family transcription factor [Paracoccus sp. (in: a-proteobacteria)]MDO5630865.1 metalloregulator ArsR/SmtB family transcription factor [Paracoccus sp. (in: a-proteobacteria)]